MPGPIANLGAVAGVMVSLASALGAQQQVKVSVTAVPNPITAGSCTRIWADVRDELNRALTLENGVPLQWGSYDYSASNGSDFEWKSTASGESELCAKPGVGAVTTQITATVKGTAYSGATVLTVAIPPAAPAQVATAAAPAISPSSGPAAPSTLPAQPYVAPTQPDVLPAQAYVPPAQAYAPPPGTAPAAPPPQVTGAAQPAAASPQPAEAQAAVKSGGGFFKKIGSHLKQKAAEVKAETAQNLTAAATQVVDTTFQTGSRLVSSTTAEVTNTARMGIGGVGQKLMLAPQRGGASADNLALAIASGRAVLLEMRFTPGTDVLEPAARELARRLAAELRTAMATAPAIKFVVEAHVDSVPGTNSQVLSEYRAAAVKAALSGNGVDATRLIALGYGTSRPLQPGGPPTARIEIARTQ